MAPLRASLPPPPFIPLGPLRALGALSKAWQRRSLSCWFIYPSYPALLTPTRSSGAFGWLRAGWEKVFSPAPPPLSSSAPPHQELWKAPHASPRTMGGRVGSEENKASGSAANIRTPAAHLGNLAKKPPQLWLRAGIFHAGFSPELFLDYFLFSFIFFFLSAEDVIPASEEQTLPRAPQCRGVGKKKHIKNNKKPLAEREESVPAPRVAGFGRNCCLCL